MPPSIDFFYYPLPIICLYSPPARHVIVDDLLAQLRPRIQCQRPADRSSQTNLGNIFVGDNNTRSFFPVLFYLSRSEAVIASWPIERRLSIYGPGLFACPISMYVCMGGHKSARQRRRWKGSWQNRLNGRNPLPTKCYMVYYVHNNRRLSGHCYAHGGLVH